MAGDACEAGHCQHGIQHYQWRRDPLEARTPLRFLVQDSSVEVALCMVIEQDPSSDVGTVSMSMTVRDISWLSIEAKRASLRPWPLPCAWTVVEAPVFLM